MDLNPLNTAAPPATGETEPLDITFVGGTADLSDPPVPDSDFTQSPNFGETLLPLTMMTIGDLVWIVNIKGGHRMIRRLTDLGLTQGSEITIVSRIESGSMIIGFQGCRIGLGAGIAHRILVTTMPREISPTATQRPAQPVNGDLTMPEPLQLGALAVGQSGHIVGYENAHSAYREKLLSMGLTPGTHFTVTRQAPMGDPIEIEVRGYKLSLRKGEAAALKVEGS
ncbi:ferrous iron transport protein A [Nodosilinea sp. LEGE 07088]|uniref:FeoA family protein n=1 Tax=Nodosilinea sp. LEGE 07088 TaxID=2777968 RepID=UPI00187E75FC|nr:ferrous iron transport protein A [Nodosilinea sp. LEGE 07088]MBE9141453.1 ferrous iron transport protein A [Nodosilinea sp. LEGE 07088]